MDEKIDFASLDPKRDPARWEQLVRATSARAMEARQRDPILRQLLAWSRPVLATAAGLAVVACAASYLGGAGGQATDEPAYALASWAQAGEIPSASSVLAVMGGDDDTL